MGLANIGLPEYGKIVELWTPQHYSHISSDMVSLKNGQKAFFIIQFNGTPNAATITFTLLGGATVTTATNACTFGNWWRCNGTAAAMLLSDTETKGAVGAASYVTTASDQGWLCIEVDPADWVTAGYDCFCVHMDAGEASQFMSAIALIVPGRYQQAIPPSAIVN